MQRALAHAQSSLELLSALAALQRIARLEGIIPALESSHALAWTLANGGSELDVVCLSGRGDKDLAEVIARLRRAGALGAVDGDGTDVSVLGGPAA